MKFLVDQNLSPLVAKLLREADHYAIHTRELGTQPEARDCYRISGDYDLLLTVLTRTTTTLAGFLLRLMDEFPTVEQTLEPTSCAAPPQTRST